MKSRILNNMVDSTADLMMCKVEYLALVREQFKEKGQDGIVSNLTADIKEIEAAVSVIRKFSGCWA